MLYLVRGDERDGYQKMRPVAVTVRDDDVKAGRGAQKVIDYLYAKKIIPMGSAGDVVDYDDGSFEVSILYPFGKKGHQKRKFIVEPEVQESQSMFNDFEKTLLESSVDPMTKKMMREWGENVRFSELSHSDKKLVLQNAVNGKYAAFNDEFHHLIDIEIQKALEDKLPWAPTGNASWAYGDGDMILPSYEGEADIDKFLLFYKDIPGVDELDRITIDGIKLIDIAHPEMTTNRMEKVEISGLIHETPEGEKLAEKLVDAAHESMEAFAVTMSDQLNKKRTEYFSEKNATEWANSLGAAFPKDTGRLSGRNMGKF